MIDNTYILILGVIAICIIILFILKITASSHYSSHISINIDNMSETALTSHIIDLINFYRNVQHLNDQEIYDKLILYHPKIQKYIDTHKNKFRLKISNKNNNSQSSRIRGNTV